MELGVECFAHTLIFLSRKCLFGYSTVYATALICSLMGRKSFSFYARFNSGRVKNPFTHQELCQVSCSCCLLSTKLAADKLQMGSKTGQFSKLFECFKTLKQKWKS